MKLARFEVDGHAVEGRVRADGRLETSAGATYAPEAVRWLPPVVGTKAVGLALPAGTVLPVASTAWP